MTQPLTIRDIAEACHETNRVVQAAQITHGIPVALPWLKCDHETRASVVDGVRAVLSGASPEESHENWSRFKRGHGWIYGPVKDPVEKTHPCLVPYADLPPEQRAKDDLFHAIVNALRPLLIESA